MTPVISCAVNNISLIPGPAFTVRKNNLTRCRSLRKPTKFALSSQRFVLPFSSSVRLFPQYQKGYELHKKCRIPILSATETDVAVEEPDLPIADEDANDGSEIQPDTVETAPKSTTNSDSSASASHSRRSRTIRKSEMPPVKNEELTPGAIFTGKVKSIQPFGAFVDFGAFTDGLVHVSRLSDSFVKDVASVVSVGQEVKVRLVEVNTDTGRISLSMRENDDNKRHQRKDSAAANEKVMPAKKNASRPRQKRDEVKSSKFVKGQDLEGTVKNLGRSGAFISLPEGEEGFLPTSEESDDGLGSMMGGSSLQVGQEVKVRVLRINRGQVTLTMKKEEEDDKFDLQVSEGVVHAATNPFVLAFRKNKDISAFLDQREKTEKVAEKPLEPKTSKEAEGKAKQNAAVSGVPDMQVQPASTGENMANVSSAADEVVQNVEVLSEKTDIVTDIANKDDEPTGEAVESFEILSSEGSASTENQTTKEAIPTGVLESDETSGSPKDEVQVQTPTAEDNISSSAPVEDEVGAVPDRNGSVTISGVESNLPDTKDIEEKVESNGSSDPSKESSDDQIKSLGSEAIEEVVENGFDNSEDKVQAETTDPNSEILSISQVEDVPDTKDIEEKVESNGSSNLSKESSDDQIKSSGSQAIEEVVENGFDSSEDKVQAEAAASDREILSTSQVEDVPDTKDIEEKVETNGSSDPSKESSDDQIKSSGSQAIEEVVENGFDNSKDKVQAETTAPKSENPSTSQAEEAEAAPKESSGISSNGSTSKENVTKAAAISPALVKQLREETGAGMMDCKKALSETGGDIVKAQEFLRKKGLASAEKKASRVTAEGRIGSYIHDSRIGVLVEVNCETDFVSRGDNFKELVEDLAMQVAACPQVEYLVTEDVSEEIVKKEREIEMQKEDLLSKPEQIRSKIVDGRIRKRLEELALLEQPYIKNDKVVVKDWIKQTIATVGENIKVKRFVRYNLGEGLQKKSQDFAAEVAAQTAAKPVTPSEKEQPAPVEAKETAQKPSTVTVSAALVKQLREETGAGMMDCKKALSETGGDLEKAQEYLRKKGLSTAEKKSSRLAAEGRIGSYIHDSRIGVLIEVNCETDFVGRSEKFKELVDDLAMQVVACPEVQFVSIEDIPESIVNKEKEIEMQREDLLSKPENIREKIVEGRVSKRLGDLVLLEQPFIKDDSVLVKDLVKQTVAALGENIKVRRFVRFTLGETSEDAKTGTEA